MAGIEAGPLDRVHPAEDTDCCCHTVAAEDIDFRRRNPVGVGMGCRRMVAAAAAAVAASHSHLSLAAGKVGSFPGCKQSKMS